MTLQVFDIMSQFTYFWQTKPLSFRSIGASPLSVTKPGGQTKFLEALSTSSMNSNVIVPSELVASLRQTYPSALTSTDAMLGSSAMASAVVTRPKDRFTQIGSARTVDDAKTIGIVLRASQM